MVKCSRCGKLVPDKADRYKLFLMSPAAELRVGTTLVYCKKCGEMKLRYFK